MPDLLGKIDFKKPKMKFWSVLFIIVGFSIISCSPSKKSFDVPDFQNPSSNPIAFIQSMSVKEVSQNGKGLYLTTMDGRFPVGWVKKKHIATLMSMIFSKGTCCCYLSPLSSTIPSGFAEKGGYAAIFVQAFKEKKPIDFGLYYCPKVDEKLNAELLDWWNNK